MGFLNEEMLQMALTSDDGLNKLKELREMEKAYNAEQAEKEYRIAMSAMQGSMPVIKKLKRNDFNNSFFASLDDVVLQMQPVLAAFGFSFDWKQKLENGFVMVKCIAHHKDGHSEECALVSAADTSGAQGKANKTSVQGTCSTVTYLRRYTYTGVFGIATADHDIDGRIEGVTQRQLTKSTTLNALMTDNKMPLLDGSKANTVEQLIFDANDLNELRAAGTLIGSITSDEDRKRVSELYNQANEGFTNG